MCKCTPSIRTPYCLKCMPTNIINHGYAILDNEIIKPDINKYEESFKNVKEIIKSINGMSEEGFTLKYMNDPHFNRGVSVLVDLIFQKNK